MKNTYIRELLTEKWIEPSYINELGTMYWGNKYGKSHNTGDKPAIIYPDGDRFWYKNGKCIK